MRKYLQVIKNTWSEYFVYRLNFVMWRVRNVLQLLTIYFLWSAIFLSSGKEEVFGYTKSLILTYILGTALLRAIILATRTLDIGDQINRGDLSNFLIRPINYFLYKVSQDVSDKTMNIFFAFFEIGFLLFLFKPSLFIQTNPFLLTFFFLAVVLGIMLYFQISFLLGMVGFWSPEVWGPRFIFTIITEFFAGGLFPLDILPKPIFVALQTLPFPYLLFFPLKVYLGGLSFTEIMAGFVIGGIWIFIIYQASQFVWQKGLKMYTAEGR